MLPNINISENGYSNFPANLRVVSLKLLELTQFACPNLSIYFNFLCAVPRDDVIESTRFLMRPPVSHSIMTLGIPTRVIGTRFCGDSLGRVASYRSASISHFSFVWRIIIIKKCHNWMLCYFLCSRR